MADPAVVAAPDTLERDLRATSLPFMARLKLSVSLARLRALCGEPQRPMRRFYVVRRTDSLNGDE